MKISDIESRISALTIAGLNIAPCVRLTRRRDQKQRSQVHLPFTPPLEYRMTWKVPNVQDLRAVLTAVFVCRYKL